MMSTSPPSAHEIVDAEDLSSVEARMLDFERQWWRYGGAKEDAIRREFGWNTTRYYQTLNNLIDSPAALETDPILVRRLRRLRTSRQEARTLRRRNG